MHYLSFVEHCQLITATLNQIPNYQMRVFSLPQKIHNQIDKIKINFLWGHSDTTTKTHHICWERITKSKRHGGLGIKRSALINADFMAKLRWDLETKNQKPWAKADLL